MSSLGHNARNQAKLGAVEQHVRAHGHASRETAQTCSTLFHLPPNHDGQQQEHPSSRFSAVLNDPIVTEEFIIETENMTRKRTGIKQSFAHDNYNIART